MNPTLLRLANGPHPNLALSAFIRFRNHVESGLLSETQLLRSIVASRATGIPENEAIQTVARAFDAARKS